MSFGIFPIIEKFLCRKRWVLEENRVKIETRDIRNTYIGTFDLVVFKVSWCICPKIICISKAVAHREKQTETN